MKQAPFYDRKNVFSLCLSLTWIYLSHLTGTGGEKVSGWVMAAAYVVSIISRVMCSKWIIVMGFNLCLGKTVYVPYTPVRTRLKR